MLCSLTNYPLLDVLVWIQGVRCECCGASESTLQIVSSLLLKPLLESGGL